MEKFCPMTKDECHGEKCAVWVPAKPTRMNYDNGSCHVLREVPAHCGLIRKMPDKPVEARGKQEKGAQISKRRSFS